MEALLKNSVTGENDGIVGAERSSVPDTGEADWADRAAQASIEGANLMERVNVQRMKPLNASPRPPAT